MTTLFLRRADKHDDVYEYLRKNVRGQTAYQISAAIYAVTKEPLKDHEYRQLQRVKLEQSPHSDSETEIPMNDLEYSEDPDKRTRTFLVSVNFLR